MLNFKTGDLVMCEYAKNEKAKGRVVSVDGDIYKVEVAITSRRSRSIDKEILEVKIDKLSEFAF